MNSDNEYFEEYSDSGNDSENEVLDDEEDDPDFGEEGEGASGSHIGDQLGLGDDEYTYDCLSTENIVSHMVKTIKEVNSVIQIPATTVRLLLNHFKWDKEKLMEKYYSEDQEAMFKEAKITSPFKKITLGKPGSTVSSHTCECEICYLTLPRSMMNGLDCGHFYCTSCWSEYLTTKIMDEGASQMIQCPGSCDMLVDDQTVMKLVTDQRVKLKYQHLITNSYVQCNRFLKWCPAVNCTNAVRVNQVEARPVRCRCSHVFCFTCIESWHDPVRCHLIKKWIKKCDDDSETSHWISANTKECPKCLATIEKDGGCNHMICKNQSCKTEFCWVCMGPWDPHGSSWYSCNRYDEDEARTARQGQEKSRYALQRYLFYCNRYMNHHQSLKFESKLYCMVKGKMDEMQQHNMSWIEVQFLRKAVDILCECRRTLMYTYVFAFYLKKNNQSEIFEDNQKDLEKSTEDLSEYLERDISAENLVDIKQKVQDKYRYCESRRKVLLAHVHEGYEKDWWEYNEPDC
ncbi:E3 ubiquitin-protein ligase arih1 [Lepeophtheirus salmonis]|uniref:E3 ubiquitin-protein ligase arih1 n=1 Tax=Lepeophtheirus salmonis TaxID=72036 RepID=UPI00077F17BC|nr:E3 ubiquitin-protein ligase arih1-like [Lepeophtheirus salmonis]XP_040566938.1 E3 ubiquitin-protein ligase arih1-like [Lepeophtheirus salmonis]XP_040566939.1 E3 ubiquitin-protein ligase arih1-like [Lepeophtheirus salmonis]XP_040566941.1 E3 ubiquitin-protein ligase arih1-like [Lepeophtheirus salmonis]